MPKRIMVVDDEESLLVLLKDILMREGYDVIPAKDGPECIEKLKTVKPDLILLDLMMPTMTGRDVCKKIRSNPKTKDLKIIFVTVARFSETERQKLNEMNISDYITKPFDNNDLLRRIKKVV